MGGIIESFEVKTIPNWIYACIVLGAILILIASFVVCSSIKNQKKALIISMSIYLILVFALLCSGVLEKPTGEYQYRVKIADDVGFVEFTDKYGIIQEYDDGTFLVQEKSE